MLYLTCQGEKNKTARANLSRATRKTRKRTNEKDCIMSEKFEFAREHVALDEIIADEKLREHVRAAINVERKRQPVLRANSSRPSTRPECRQCGVGIRKETNPVNGMHPKCAKVADDASFAAKMPINSHAARSLHDAKIIPALHDDAKKRHAELLARLEAEAIAEENAAKKA